MIVHVETLEDERLDAYVRLTEVQLRNRLEPEKGIFIAESEKVITRALDAGYLPESLLIPEHRLQRSAALVERIEAEFCASSSAAEGDIPLFVAPSDEIEKLTGFELTRGVLCAMKRKPLPSLDELLRDARRVAVLEDITNHTNVGAVFRNAAALGFDAVIVTPGCCDPLYRRAIRVSMGTVFQVPWTRFKGTVTEWHNSGVRALKQLGFTTVALALHDESVELDDARLKEPKKLAVLLGTEGEGLSQKTIEASDFVAKIPMREQVDSLNVAAASAVAFWELRARS
jgi:tRNA G18 (ribose-2'-O)-methylase SpoU